MGKALGTVVLASNLTWRRAKMLIMMSVGVVGSLWIVRTVHSAQCE